MCSQRGHWASSTSWWAGAIGSALLISAGLRLGELPAPAGQADRFDSVYASPAQEYPRPIVCAPPTSPCERITNTFVRADVAKNGSWALGTTGGDPATLLDDFKNLLYGFAPGGASQLATTFTTVRFQLAGGPMDVVPDLGDVDRQFVDSDGSLVTVWRWTRPAVATVTQTLQIVNNPFSGRTDLVSQRYTVENGGDTTIGIGVRSVLDVKLGGNDGAPYFVPGLGTLTTERALAGDQVPPFWLAFESPSYDPTLLRGIGVLRGPDLTPPDKLLFALWIDLQNTRWDYTPDATKPITRDSTVALYWEPRDVAPGQTFSLATGYGVASNQSGGQAFMTAPVEAACGDSFTVAMFINNFDVQPLANGSATLTLPAGATLDPGESLTKSLPDIPPGTSGSVAWSVTLQPGTSGKLTFAATTTFDGGRRFSDEHEVTVSCVAPTPTPSPQPTATATARPTRTATPTATPGPSPIATPISEACTFILSRVPAAAINAALANPAAVRGWNQLGNPGLPRSPANPPRRRLSILNIASPYHPIFNPLVYKVGCP